MDLSSEEEQQGNPCRPQSGEKVELENQDVEEEAMEEDTPLVALAPDASLPEEQQSATTDVSASPAFQCLDEVRPLNALK